MSRVDFIRPATARLSLLTELLLLDAVTIGDVTGLEGLAQELVAGDASEAMLGHRVARLVADFDFDGLRDLADSLNGEEDHRRAVE